MLARGRGQLMITWYRVCLGMESAGRPRSIYTVGVAVNSGEIAATVTMFLICVHKSLSVFAKQSRLLMFDCALLPEYQ